jgi:uncharacterized membrane protein YhaH (DUF805 family)
MGSMSILHMWMALGTIAVFLIIIVPSARILRRTGHSGWWCLLIFVPMVNMLALWIFAYASWPAVDRQE